MIERIPSILELYMSSVGLVGDILRLVLENSPELWTIYKLKFLSMISLQTCKYNCVGKYS